jgi:hypothetical protein
MIGLLALVLALVGAGVAYWRHRLAPDDVHGRAVADASRKVDTILDGFGYDHLYLADEYAHSAAQHPDVDVLSVHGDAHWQAGVTLVLRVSGSGEEIGADGSVIDRRDELICFRVQLGPDDDSRDDDVDCPPGEPLTIATDPSLSGVDERLERRLRAAGPTEPEVVAAVEALALDPGIQRDIAARDGTVGVALRAAQFDCVLARVTASGPELWRPSHTQLAPGELSCTAESALGESFGRSPH